MYSQDLKSKTIKGFIWRFNERLISHLINFVATLVLARLLMPEDYGVIAIVMVFVNIANVFVINGLNTALVQKKNVDDIDYDTVFYATLILSSILYLILYFMAPYIALYYNNTEVSKVLRVLGLLLPLSSFNSVQNAKVSRNLNFKYFFFVTSISVLISGFAGVLLALCDYGVWALVGQQLSNVILSTIFLSSIIRWHPKIRFSYNRLKGFINFGGNLMFASLFGTIFNQLRNFLVGMKYTPADLAYMTTGDSFPSLISNNIDASINAVLFPALSKVQDDRNEVKQGMRRAMMSSCYIVVPCLFMLIGIADKLVLLLLTDKWIAAVPYVRILSVGYCFSILSNANLQSLSAIGRSDIVLKLEFFKKPFLLLILLVSMHISPLAIAGGTTIYSFIVLIINLYPNKKLINYGLLEQFKDVTPQFFLSIIMSIVVFVIGYVNLNIIFVLSIQIISGILIYIGLSHLFKLQSYMYLRELLSNFLKSKQYGK